MLESLGVDGTDITDAGVETLKDLKSLKEFGASRSNVTSAGLAQLQQTLPSCVVSPKPQALNRRSRDFPLWAPGSKPSRADVVSKIKELKGDLQIAPALPGQPIVGLRIFDIDISDESLLALLTEMPNLESLNLRHLLVGNAFTEGLEKYRELREIHLQDTRIGDDALLHIAKLPKLEELDLQETRVSDGGLALLKQSQNLRQLQLNHTRATPAGVDDLRKALPQCTISY